MRTPNLLVPILTALLLALPGTLAAQAFPGFGSVEGRAGVVQPENASLGFAASVDLGLGYIGTPSLRTVVGANYFTADVDRTDATGSLTVIGGRVGVRFDLLPTASLSPYLIATINGHNIDANLNSPTVADILSGFNVGAGIGVGIAYALDEGQRTRVTLEGRQVFINNVDHWSAELGIRLVPRGRQAYDRVVRYRDPFFRDEAALTAAERERARAERERLEAERLRTEQQREEQERQRQEQERLARMTEEERARARQELEQQRLRADTLQEAARREGEARAAAEREAERLRAEREVAEAATREAELRAAAAEQRLYQALLDLDRLIANISEIRETERGLVIVLGQGLFASGQSALSPQARSEVRQIATVLTQFPEHRIAVEGHTDSVGSETANQRLSEQRAESVRAALIAEGIDPGRVDMLGYGQSRPIADNTTAQGRAQNRRVEIVILGARRPGVTP